MAELLPCPFCGGEAVIRVLMGNEYICPIHKSSCIIKPDTWLQSDLPIKKQIKAWNTRTPKERGGDTLDNITNYERIKNMSVGEMAEYLSDHWSCVGCAFEKVCDDNFISCHKNIKQWLLQEVDDG